MSWWEILEFLSKLVNVGTVYSLGQNNKNTAKKLINMWIVENRNTHVAHCLRADLPTLPA